ncbi:AAA domain-containing protein [Marininema mesophilum]|nr:AAA domain-containing protein [Marininema mesophilum]
MYVTANPQQLFNYLLAIKQMEHRSIRHIKNYEEYRYLDDLPQGEGCWLFGKGSDTEAWMEVGWLEIEKIPETDPLFIQWLKGDPTTESTLPQVYEEMEVTDQIEGATNVKKVRFEEDSARVSAYADWLSHWKEWSQESKRRRAIQGIYDKLYSIHNQLERGDEVYEVSLGHGLLRWDHPKESIAHPLLVTPLEIFYDASKASFILKPTQKETRVDVDLLQGLDLPHEKELLSQINQGQAKASVDPRDESEAHLLYQEIACSLHPEGKFQPESTLVKGTEHPVILDRPVWFIRKRIGKLWIEEFNRTIQALDDGLTVPVPIQSLLQTEVIHPNDEEQEAWAPIAEELYFPLPTNEEQRGVVRKLSQRHGVVVQGPPGTGKSHTIANLISHLLAHGKKVLVTSQKEPALRVLADKIPAEIRSLCVSVLGGDSQSLREVEASIESISQQMDSVDTNRLAEQIQRNRQKLRTLRDRMAKGKAELHRSASRNHEPIEWKGEQWKPMDAARLLTAEEKKDGWFPDEVTGNPPIKDADLARLWRLAATLPREAPEVARYRLPEKEKLLSPAIFEERLKEGEELKRKAEISQGLLNRYPVLRDQVECRGFSKLLDPVLQQKGMLETLWLRGVVEDALAGGERQRVWSDLVVSIQGGVSELATLYDRLAEHALELPDIPLVELKEDLKSIRGRLTSGKGLGKMYFMTSGRKLRYLLDETLVDGRGIRTPEDIELLQDLVTYREKRERLVHKWNMVVNEVDGPTLHVDEIRLIPQLDDHRRLIEKARGFADSLTPLREWVEQKFATRSYSWSNPGLLEEWANAAGAALRDYRWKEWLNAYEKEAEAWLALSRTIGSHPICDLLAEAWRSCDVEEWYEAHGEAERLIDIQDRFNELTRMIRPLEEAAPIWTRRILERLGNPGPYPERWKEAWHWKRVHTQLKQIHELDPAQIQRDIHEAEKMERRVIQEIVADSAWREQLLRITEQERRSLHAWKQKIKRIGKGTGKYADKYRREAREEMEQCQSAIPVWVMPIHRVIENLSLTNERFDVVIVDESSQCDLFFLAALMRADRAVVVGDDQQISPQSIGTNQEVVRALMTDYLEGLPQSSSLDTLTSLYDIAIRVFGGHLMLREHFRSVPEIVQFSNELSYHGEIVPLRIPTIHEQMSPPVLAQRIQGRRDPLVEINRMEAEAIVADIARMVEDPVFKGQSMGVITLLGQKQAPLIEQKLRETIGEEEMVKRKIQCGDAYTFQGDERDIIFLSMVIADNVRYMPLTKVDARQRLNVAVSRARNQLRLYHSVDLAQLHPKDFRHTLLKYCLDPKLVQEKREDNPSRCESDLERDVLEMVMAKGYRVRPQVQVGHERYCIDLVIEGEFTRLAVECDGDQWHGMDTWEYDMIRQKTLERAGWTFWRIRGSQFYRNPDEAMAPLWEKLQEMGIEQELMYQH